MNATNRLATALFVAAFAALTGCDTGPRIVFSSDRDGDEEIYKMNQSGGGIVQLTMNGDDDHGPVYSEDGTKIAFASDRDGNWEVYIMNSDGTDQVRLTENEDDDYPCSINVSKNTILFWTDRDGNFEVYRMNLDGSDPENLTNHEADDREGTLSPDGAHIAFTSNREDFNYDVYIMNADGGDVQRLTDDAATDQTPAFSPDSTQIAFSSARDGHFEIYIMGIDGEMETRVTKTDSDHSSRPAFRGDAARMTFIRIEDFQPPDIWTMNPDGSGEVNITPAAASWDDFPTYAGSL